MNDSGQMGRPSITTTTVEQVNELANSQDTLEELGLDEEVSTNDASSMALKEDTSIGNKNLEHVSRNNQHRRDEDWKSLFDIAFKWIFRLIAVLFAFMIVALILHWILPEYCHWLTTSQLSKLEAVVLAVLVSKAVTSKQGKIE